MVKFYITICVLLWAIFLSGLRADQTKGWTYTADFLHRLGSNGQTTACSGACYQYGLCNLNLQPNAGKAKRRGTKGSRRTINAKGIKCCLMNARSIMNKTVLIKDIITENNIDVAIITETWLTSNGKCMTALNDITPNNYKVMSKPRCSKRGGGLAIIHRSEFNTHEVDIKSVDITAYEQLTLSISDLDAADKQLFVAVYRPPSKPVSQFTIELQQHLDEVRLHRGTVTLAGDLNMHLEKSTPTTKKVHDVLDGANIELNPTASTHIHGHVLDAVATEYPVKVKVFDPCLSDHSVLIYHLRRGSAPYNIPRKSKPRYTKTRNFTEINVKNFSSELETSLINIPECKNPDDMYMSILSNFTTLLDKYAPIVRRRCKTRNFKFDAEVANAKRKRRQLERKYHKSKLQIDRQILLSQNKIVSRLVQNAKGKYYTALISESRNSTRTLFKVFSDLSTDSRILTPTTLAKPAEAMAEFFHNKVATLSQHFPKAPSYRYVDDYADFKLDFFSMVSIDDIRKITVKCSSEDLVPTRFMKLFFPALLISMTNLINLSFETGCFPTSLKKAVVIPIIKDRRGDVNQLKNYRPISLLNFISKIIERVAINQLDSYIRRNNLENPMQSAYKQFHSVETTLLALQSELLEVLDCGKAAFLILLDLSSAFDTVDHGILLNVLNSRYHVTGTALRWFQSYLAGRSFRVRVGDQYSASRPSTTGVPQGSVLGPILFNILSSGIDSIFHEFGVAYYCYADDTQFYVTFDPKSEESEREARLLISRLFRRLVEWMANHHLKLNDNKTTFLPVCRDSGREFAPLSVGNCLLSPARKIRNLGFIFNRSLTIVDHVKHLRKNAFYHLQRIRSLRHCISFVNREILVHAFITSRLDFCNSLFYGSTCDMLKNIKSIQGATAKALTGVHPMHSNTTLYFKLHWLPINSRISYKLAMMGFKIVHHQAPQYFSDIRILSNTRHMRSTSAPLLTSDTYVRTSTLKKYGDRSCFNTICSVFNALPSDIRAAKDLSSFKFLLKKHLFMLTFKAYF